MPIKRNKRESEKVIEHRLGQIAKQEGGFSIKLLSTYITGLPDRLLVLPPGYFVFVELKSSDGKLSRAQKLVHMKLRLIGCEVYVVDSRAELKKLIVRYKSEMAELEAAKALRERRKYKAADRFKKIMHTITETMGKEWLTETLEEMGVVEKTKKVTKKKKR